MDRAPNLRADAYQGTATAYLRYRPPYPKAMLTDLLAHLAAPAPAALLDLACGPGRVALALAASFRLVWAVDLEPEMVDVGRQEAERRGIRNIYWLVGPAEDAAMAPNSVDLITIGEAFHRLDQRLIVEKALIWLKSGGCIATLGTEGILAGGEPWQQVTAEVAQHWIARALPTGRARGRVGAALGPSAYERVLRNAGFTEVESRVFMEPWNWSFEEIVGYLHSTSVCSEKVLGIETEAFEADLRAALGAGERTIFHETMNCGYTIGRKPA